MMRFVGLFAAFCALTTPAWADESVILAANEAIDRHDTLEAVMLLTPAADAGDAHAQALLGSILLRGAPDVPRDENRAADYMQRAAHQGSAQAQLNLGGMFKEGRGVPRDSVQAHFWMSLGLARITPPTPTPGDREAAATLFALDSARYERDQLASYMTVYELAESERLQRAWTPRIEQDGQ